ncbi:Dynein assembly factor 3, axonemal [Hondaea fermentalgiana]|uniref:Dynein assembly factor 3, axonemal n=1 Tax=Hondaea fermentalgiana TaxID=2315210 RepID=A0A2R5G4K9_9STRA|nr:Dynein assembly factor 3, axonemal [Hondaea fermentalgiana]|eukprot:GBG25249.1 Dynein assembly factor 3, axonemal [Hondaea fermentalgiana]
MEGLGVHRFWGLSPAEDLTQLLERAREESGGAAEDDQDDVLRVLCIGAGDIRHALRTAANLRRKQKANGCKRRVEFREVDALEQVLKSWSEGAPFDVQNLRDRRLRHFYGQRYDHRVGIVDGDYQNAVKPHASIIHYKQYKHWRETGIAFEFGDETYTMPNRSMASYAKGRERGESKLRRGFWTDVQVGPYFAWGIDCERTNQHATDLFKVANKGMATEQHRHTAVHVAVFNVLSMLHTLETGASYTMRKAGDVYSGIERPSDPQKFATSCAEGIMQLKDNVSIVLMSGDSVQSALSSRIMRIIIEKNMNPIERVERSSLIVASTITGKSVPDLLAPAHHQRIKDAAPQIYDISSRQESSD